MVSRTATTAAIHGRGTVGSDQDKAMLEQRHSAQLRTPPWGICMPTCRVHSCDPLRYPRGWAFFLRAVTATNGIGSSSTQRSRRRTNMNSMTFLRLARSLAHKMPGFRWGAWATATMLALSGCGVLPSHIHDERAEGINTKLQYQFATFRENQSFPHADMATNLELYALRAYATAGRPIDYQESLLPVRLGRFDHQQSINRSREMGQARHVPISSGLDALAEYHKGTLTGGDVAKILQRADTEITLGTPTCPSLSTS